MASIIRIVDKIDAAPTTRLDLHDSTVWKCLSFVANPPRLRRAMSSNAMTDGVFVSSSSYDARTLQLELEPTKTTVDLLATELQKLARELNRADNYLMYQEHGASKPVFFKWFRSEMTEVADVRGPSTAVKSVRIELLAEPFAVGLRETLGPFTVNNNPAAGSNGLYFDASGVIGDVASPAVLVDSSPNSIAGAVAARHRGTASDLVHFIQAESCTLGTDTTNPGGGPDAAMSGTGTNNYVRTSFASPSLLTRITWPIIAAGTSDATRRATQGRYRVLACLRRSDASSVITVRATVTSDGYTVTGQTITTELVLTDRRLVDLGVFTIQPGAVTPGRLTPIATLSEVSIALQSARTSGAGTLDWDYVMVLPADESLLMWTTDATSLGSLARVYDAANEAFYYASDASTLFTGGGKVGIFNKGASLAGGFPSLAPGESNRIYMVHGFGTGSFHDVTDVQTISVHYWPRYLYVRPSAT